MEHIRANERPPMVFTLTPEEEEALKQNYGTVLHDRKAGSADVGDHVSLDGKDGVYEAVVESVQASRSGFETDRDFAVSVLRWPHNPPK